MLRRNGMNYLLRIVMNSFYPQRILNVQQMKKGHMFSLSLLCDIRFCFSLVSFGPFHLYFFHKARL